MGKESSLGAIAVNTGEFTGRSPMDRFIVNDDITSGKIWWGDINIPFDAENFDTSNSYSTSTYEFTAPTDGLYHFQVQIMMEDGDDREFELVLRVDADGTGGGLPSIVARNAQRALDGTDTDTSYQINKMVQLTQGAIVDIRLLQVVVGAGIIDQDLFGSQANSYFSGYLVR